MQRLFCKIEGQKLKFETKNDFLIMLELFCAKNRLRKHIKWDILKIGYAKAIAFAK